MNTFMGFGDVAVQATAVQPSIWDKLNTVITKVVQPAANVYTQVKTNQMPSSQTQQYPVSTVSTVQSPIVTPPPLEKTDNTKKYLIIGGVVVALGTGIYFATRKKKGK